MLKTKKADELQECITIGDYLQTELLLPLQESIRVLSNKYEDLLREELDKEAIKTRFSICSVDTHPYIVKKEQDFREEFYKCLDDIKDSNNKMTTDSKCSVKGYFDIMDENRDVMAEHLFIIVAKNAYCWYFLKEV
ncbi:MAG: hypothetical protein ACOCRX_08130 [Candidatus Woesearchaeota archaeon]